MTSGSHPRTLWQQTGLAFWLFIFAVAITCAEFVATSLLPVNLTLIAFGFVGAFLGSSPLILMPTIARLAFGTGASIGRPQHWVGRLYLLGVTVLATVAAAVRIFPHENWTGCATSEAGVIAAVLAGAFTAEFRPAVLLWLRRRHRSVKKHDHGGDPFGRKPREQTTRCP
jgi:hypothetical protein